MKNEIIKSVVSIIALCAINLMFAKQGIEDNETNKGQEKPIIRKLDNGFQYIIKPLSQEVEKNEIRLVVNAGKFQEDKDQPDHAHLLEHLAFNYLEGYTNFSNNTDLLSRLNLRKNDLHAFTFSNNTLYQFIYPKDENIALDTILDYSYEIASGKVVFNEEQINAERKAVYQEYLLQRPIKYYSHRKIFSKLLSCDKDVPNPDEFESLIMDSSTGALKRFYRDWYRPDLMTLIVVGNFRDPKIVERKIQKMFKDISMPEHPRQKTNCINQYLTKPSSFTVENNYDEKLSDSQFKFYFRQNSDYLFDYQKLELWTVLRKIISNRLKTLRYNYNIDYSANFEIYPSQSQNILTITNLGKSKQSISEIFSILSGISANGITSSEFENVKDLRLEQLNEPPRFPIDYWADFYTEQIVYGAQDFELKVNDKILFLENLEVSTVNSYLKNYTWNPDDISILLPKNRNKDEYNKRKVLKTIKDGLNNPQKPKKIEAPEQLLTEEISELSAATIVSKSQGRYGEEVIELENGLRLVLKKNKSKGGRYKDKIMIHGFSPIGASYFGVADYEAMLSPSLIKNAGLGRYNKFELAEFLENTSFQYELNDYITPSETGFEGAFIPTDLEAFLQVIYLSFTAPRFDKEAWEDWKIQELKYFNRNSEPNNNFIDFRDRNTGNIKLPQGGERYQESLKLDYEKAFKKYKILHSNADNYTVLITGDFQRGKILPLLQKYLGNLPSFQIAKNQNKNEIKEDTFQINQLHHTFSEPVDNSYLSIQYRIPYNHIDFKTEIELELLKAALDIKVRTLRYNKFLGVYSATAIKKINPDLNTNSLEIYLQCSKSDFKEVKSYSEAFFKELKTELIDANMLRTIKKAAYLPKWNDLTKYYNNSIMKNLYGHYRYDWQIANPNEASEYLQKFSAEDLKKAAEKYFKTEYRWIFTGESSNL